MPYVAGHERRMSSPRTSSLKYQRNKSLCQSPVCAVRPGTRMYDGGVHCCQRLLVTARGTTLVGSPPPFDEPSQVVGGWPCAGRAMAGISGDVVYPSVGRLATAMFEALVLHDDAGLVAAPSRTQRNQRDRGARGCWRVGRW